MTLHNRLMRMTAGKPMRIIEINGEPYLERYYMGRLFGRQIWLHRFLRNDGERHVHCHPWSALSIILTGEYWEEVPGHNEDLSLPDYLHRPAPCLNWIPAEKRHRIASVNPDTWSLMIVGKRTGRGWFFYHPDGSVTPGVSGSADWHKTALTRAQAYMTRRMRKAAAHEAKKVGDAS